jgi:hypothetical protein
VEALSAAHIDEHDVKLALERIRKSRRDLPEALLALRVVTAFAADTGRESPYADPASSLSELIRRLVCRHLAAERGVPVTSFTRASSRSEAAAQLVADFAVDNPQREAWSCLYYRYLEPYSLQVRQIAQLTQPASPHCARQIHRRIDRGVEQLARVLRELERAEWEQSSPTAATTNGGAASLVRPAGGAKIQAHSLGRDEGSVAAGDSERAARTGTQVPAPVEPQEARFDVPAYLLSRVNLWSAPGRRLTRRFIPLRLHVEHAEGAAEPARTPGAVFDDLGTLLETTDAPAVLLAGPAGSGKTTLLRRLELDVALDGLRRRSARVPFLVSLESFGTSDAIDEPWSWLCRQWNARYPSLPDLDALAGEGRLALLLDRFETIAEARAGARPRAIDAWRDCLRSRIASRAGNRAVVACRDAGDPARPAGTEIGLARARVTPLTDEQIQAFLQSHLGARTNSVWKVLGASSRLDELRVPGRLAERVDGIEQGGAALDDAWLARHFLRDERDR